MLTFLNENLWGQTAQLFYGLSTLPVTQSSQIAGPNQTKSPTGFIIMLDPSADYWRDGCDSLYADLLRQCPLIGVKNNHIFGIPDTSVPILGDMMTVKDSSFDSFDKSFLIPTKTLIQLAVFRKLNWLNIKICFYDPRTAHVVQNRVFWGRLGCMREEYQ